MSHDHAPKVDPQAPVTCLCIYRVKAGEEPAFRALLAKHWPTLDKLGLVTKAPVKIHRSVDRQKRVCYIEVFTWVNAAAPDICHKTPAVMQVWEPMGAILDSMEFLDIEDAGL